MGTTSVRKSVLGIVNEVERKLGLRESTRLDERAFTKVLVDLLNDVIDEVSDYGDWQEMYREIEVSGSGGEFTFELAVSSQVKDIYEIHWGDQIAPLENRTIEVMRRLRRTSATGVPRQFAIVGVSGVNPLVEYYPTLSTAEASGKSFNVAFYKKPRLFTTVSAEASAVPAFPSRVLVQGLYAKALLEEQGGQPGNNFQAAYIEYQRMLRESYNRLTADTGTDIYLVPTGRLGR